MHARISAKIIMIGTPVNIKVTYFVVVRPFTMDIRPGSFGLRPTSIHDFNT